MGKHLVKELAKNNIEVVVVDRPGGKIEKSEFVTSYLQLDLNSAEETRQIPFKDIDGVIHLAGLAAVGPSFDDPMLYITTNMGIEVNLFEAALAQQAKPRFLVVSSGNLYDASAHLPLTENSLVSPSSPYDVSKMGQEQLAQYYETRDFECIIARPFNHFGPGQGLGFIVPDLTKQVIEIEKGLSSEILVGNLDAQRDYTDVRDIARAYRLLLEKGKTGEIYNLCSGVAHSGSDMLAGILANTDCKPEIKQDSSKVRPSDNPIIYGSPKKLTDHTGWKPEIPFETTLADVVADWRSRV